MKKLAAIVSVLSAVLLLAVCVPVHRAAAASPAGEALTGTVSEDAAVLFYEACGDTRLLAYTDDTTYIRAADGSRSTVTEYPGQFAFLRGGCITVVSDLEDFFAVQRFDADTFAELDFFPLDIQGQDLYLLETDESGRLYAVLYSEPDEILVFDAEGSYTGSLLYAEPVHGIQVLDGSLYVFLDSYGERIPLGAGFPQTGTDEFAYAGERPYRMLNAGTYIDVDGNLRDLGGTVLFRTEINPMDLHLTALQDDLLFWASSGDTVSRVSLHDGLTATHPAEGRLEMLTASEMLVRRDNVFYRVPYGDFTVVPTPTPAPTPTPSAAPSASPTPKPSATPKPTPTPTREPEPVDVTYQGTYLIVPEGTTAARLRAFLSPADVQVYTYGMTPATGNLRTGQTASIEGILYTVVIPGDVNGSGTVNTADLRLLQRCLAGDETLDDASHFAADLSGDGTVDAADLVLLAGKIAG